MIASRFGSLEELAHAVGDHRLGTCVHAQGDISGKLRKGAQGSFRRHDLQFDAIAQRVSLGEPEIRASLRSSREPGERLDCEAVPALDVEHGLENVTEPASFEEAVDPPLGLEPAQRPRVQDIGDEAGRGRPIILLGHPGAGRVATDAGEERIRGARQVDGDRDHDADELGEARQCRDVPFVERSWPEGGDTENSGGLCVAPQRHAHQRPDARRQPASRLDTGVARGVVGVDSDASAEREPGESSLQRNPLPDL